MSDPELEAVQRFIDETTRSLKDRDIYLSGFGNHNVSGDEHNDLMDQYHEWESDGGCFNAESLLALVRDIRASGLWSLQRGISRVHGSSERQARFLQQVKQRDDPYYRVSEGEFILAMIFLGYSYTFERRGVLYRSCLFNARLRRINEQQQQ